MDSRPSDDDLSCHPRPYWASSSLSFLFGRLSLEAQHERRLRVGGPDQSPSFGELNAYTIEINDVIVLAEIFGGPLGNSKFLLVGTVHADLRC